MPDAAAGVLVTRPEPGASETAARIAALGYQPIVASLLEIRILHAALPPSGHVQAVLATSGNAIAALPASHRHLPLFAVGDATAGLARAAGFAAVHSASGDAGALAALVARDCDRSAGPLLFPCGRGQGHELAATCDSAALSWSGARSMPPSRCVCCPRPRATRFYAAA